MKSFAGIIGTRGLSWRLHLPLPSSKKRWALLLGATLVFFVLVLGLSQIFRINLGPTLTTSEQVPSLEWRDMLGVLTRYGYLPTATGGKEISLDALLATPQYFAGSRRQAPESALAKPSLLFYVRENTHIDDLPEASPEPYLRVGSTSLGPVERVIMADSYHHRTTVIRFSAADLTETAKLEGSELALVFPAPDGP